MKKRVFAFITACFVLFAMSLSVIAHSGRTDSSGGHKDNKNKSGLGPYHYHCGGYPAHLHSGGVCPYKGGSSSSSSSSKSSTSSSSSSSKSTSTGSSASSSKTSSYVAPQKVYATDITAINVPSQIDIGSSADLSASVYPKNAEDSTISWESSDKDIITVTSSGKLTAVGVGTAVVTAKTSRGTSKKFTITVNEIMAQSIAFSVSSTDILLGSTTNLKYQFTPENTTDQTVAFSSSDESVISVSDRGVIKALELGSATITVKHKELSDSVTLTVQPIEATEITLVYPNDVETNEKDIPKLEVKDTLQLSAQIMPENTTFKDIVWSVSDHDIASIDEKGVLTALKSGTVVVTATTVNGLEDTQEIELYSDFSGIVACVAGLLLLAVAGAVVGIIINNKKETVE